MKKTVSMLLVLSLAFCVIFLGCAGGGSSGEMGAGVPAAGDAEHIDATPGANGWGTYADSQEEGIGGTSTMALAMLEKDGMPAYKFSGATGPGAPWPYAQAVFHPDAATLEKFKNATGVSFMVQGDGREYMVQYLISSVIDWGFHNYVFTATAEPTRVTIPMAHFMQPSWATWRRLDTSRFTKIQWATFSWAYSGKPEPYEFTIWDLQVH